MTYIKNSIEKLRIFIGSSYESKNIAEQVKKLLEDNYECVIWFDNFFKLNNNTYHSLYRQAISFDYAIFIGSIDDIVIRKSSGDIKYTPRDNIYLELGLYAGILSPSRSFFILHKDITIATDLLGITVLKYDNYESIENCCKIIKSTIQQEAEISRISLLPSTSLAIGYFNNFLNIAAKQIYTLETIMIDNDIYNVSQFDKVLTILIPNLVDSDWKSWADMYFMKYNIKKVNIKSNPRDFSLIIDYDFLKNDNVLKFIDIPYTASIAFKAVDLVLGIDYIGQLEINKNSKKKELSNFIKTLNNLIVENSFAAKTSKIEIITP